MPKFKHAILLIGLVSFCGQSYGQVKSNNQLWECALDLHQGDKGTLSLDKEGDGVDGFIRFSRNDNVFESAVTGKWSANEIQLTRLLDAGSTELMTGIAVALGTKKMNIGGRYAADYQGVWSADCDLVSESNVTDKVESQVFTTTKVTPEMLTDKQKATFNISASHPAGVKQLSIFLGSKEIHTCAADKCEFSYGPFSKGIYSWRVEGISNSDSKSIEMGRIIVQGGKSSGQLTASPKKVNECRISGQATGASAPLSQVYSVKLYGPDTTTLLKSTSGFVDGVYQFRNLPAGQYQLIVDTKGDHDITAFPASTTLNCKSQSTLTQDISFN